MMRPPENHTPFVATALGLTLAVLVSFQVYLLREPGRIADDEARDRLIAEVSGRSLFAENCAMCHGEDGEGVDGPPLNDSSFLANTPDETIFSLIGSGVPGSEMPAWSQVHGGPLTDQQLSQVVAFIRSWEADAPDRQEMAMIGDPVQGLAIFNNTCIVCHGETGLGTERAPGLNDPAKLAQFDDDWYADTISEGRPAQGMPTWGTVLSPTQVRDLVALLRAWGRGEIVMPPGPEDALGEALHMLDHGDMHAAEHALEDAAGSATGDVLTAIHAALESLEAGDTTAAAQAIHEAQELLGAGGDETPMDGDHEQDH